MKQKKTLFILLLAFVLLIGGAYILYQQLGSQVTPDQLSVQTPSENPPDPTPEAATPSPSESPAASQDTESTESQITLAPDFRVYDRDGNAVLLSDFFGKPIVVNFWASWCNPCQDEMPAFEKKYQELGDEVNFLMVNVTDGGRETMEKATDFLTKTGYTFPVFFDTDLYASSIYAAVSIPATYFIDAQGGPVVRVVGSINGDILQQGIDMIMSPQ